MSKELSRRAFLKLGLYGFEAFCLYALVKELNLLGETNLAEVAQYYLEQPLTYQATLSRPDFQSPQNNLSAYDWQTQTLSPLTHSNNPIQDFIRSLGQNQPLSLTQDHFNPLKNQKRVNTELMAIEDYSQKGLVVFYRGADQLHDLEKSWIELLIMKGFGVLVMGYGEHSALSTEDYISNVTSPQDLLKDLQEIKKLDYSESEDGLLALLNLQKQGLYNKKMPLHLVGLSYGANQVIILANLLHTLGLPVDKVFSYGGMQNFKHLNTDILTPSDALRHEYLHTRRETITPKASRQALEILSPASYQNRLPTPWKHLVLANAAEDRIVDPRQTRALANALSPSKRDYLVVPGGHFLDYSTVINFYNQIQAGEYRHFGQNSHDLMRAKELAAALPQIDQFEYKPEQKLAMFASLAAGL